MNNTKIFRFNLLRTACTVLWGEDRHCVIVDPGCQDDIETGELTGFIAAEGLEPDAVLLTHAHPDHFCATAALHRRYGIPVYLGPGDKPFLPIFKEYGKNIGMDIDIDFPTVDAVEGMVIPVGSGLRLRVIETPGHSAGGVCYYDEADGILLSGDTLFAGCIGRSDFDGGDYDALIASILEKLIPLPGDTLVIPGHGATTTIGTERATNPFLEPFNQR